MSTAAKRTTTTTTVEPSTLDRAIEITEYGTNNVITLTMGEVRKFVANPTRSGKLPSDRDIVIFLKTCKARGLNPYQKDVYLVGYDSKDGAKFETIVALGALLKRAEGSEGYEGKEYGVLVSREGELKEVKGDIMPDGCTLVGGWCRVFRNGKHPEFATASLKSYAKDYGYWSTDKPWMIAKCAIAKALRQAFPSDVGDLTIHEELGAAQAAANAPVRLTDRLASVVAETEHRAATEAPAVEPVEVEEEQPASEDLWHELEVALADAESLGDLSSIDEQILDRFPVSERANAKALVDAKAAKFAKLKS